MQIAMPVADVTALMLRLPAEARGDVGFVYAEPDLTIPEAWAEAANAVMAEEGWREPPQVVQASPVEKLAAFLSANPDVAALING